MAKLGIDLGTSNSVAAVVFDADKKNAITVEPSDGCPDGREDRIFPSYVAFNKKGEMTAVGLLAREKLLGVGKGDLVVRHFKRLIGKPFDFAIEKINKGDRSFSEFRDRIKPASDGSILVTVGERDISVVEIASYLLKKIVEDSQALICTHGEKIDSVVISIPAAFDGKQRQATIEAAKLAGLEGPNITVIEEPTAAAVAKGLANVEGNIMVVDVGAGTTDVIIGLMTGQDGINLTTSVRDGDDILGGIDMDELILKYLLENDTGLPKLGSFLDELPPDQRLRLMRKIEEAKITASLDGQGTTSIRLSLGRGTESRLIRVELDETILSSIVAPLVNGYEVNGYLKGIRPVVEKTLLQAAGGNKTLVPKVIDEIEWLILVGGPCRMRCVHQMLKDVFKNNKRVIAQLNHIEPLNPFFMEGVARGAALSQGEGIHVTTSVPYTVSIFHQAGVTPVIANGISYIRGESTSRPVNIPMTQGSNYFWIVWQKGSQPEDWTMDSHIVNVPEEGKLEVSLNWDEGGGVEAMASVKGCGLTERIILPQKSHETTMGKALTDSYRFYFEKARDLRNLIKWAREPLVRLLVPRVGTATEAEAITDEWLRVEDYELRRCEAIDIDSEATLTEDDFNFAMKRGRFEARSQSAIDRGLLSEQSTKVLGRILPLLLSQTPTTAEELLNEVKQILITSRNCSHCIQFWQQLTEWSHKLELTPEDTTAASAAVTALGALADCLYNQQGISEEELSRIRDVCWRFHYEGK